MFVLHVVRRSLVRGTPGRIARYWGTWLEGFGGAAVCLERPGGWTFRDALNPRGYFCADYRDKSHPPRELLDLCARADVIHCHDDGYPPMLGRMAEGKIWVHHAHIGDLPRRMFSNVKYDERVKHAVITNGYGRHYDAEEKRTRIRWGRLADILEIENPIMRPPPGRAPGPLRVAYTFSNRAPRGARINAKSPDEHKAIVAGLDGVEFRWVNGVSFERAMAEKRAAHVVLDEVFTPYTNLSLLEGASVGACVLANFDDYTALDLCGWLGCPINSLPFIRVTPETLRGTLEALRDDPKGVAERGRAARAWMERWYSTRRLLEKYVEFYRG